MRSNNLPDSFPKYAIQAKAVRQSAAAFTWLKDSVLLPSVMAFALKITSFSGCRNSCRPASLGFYKETHISHTELE